MKLFLIDGHALIFKMYYAFLGRPMVNSKGSDTSILYGFTKYLLELIRKEQPTHMAVSFDLPGGTFRNGMYPQYKANREETPQLVIDALEPLEKIVEALGIPVVALKGFEADDVIGSLAKRCAGEGFDVYMVTPDKDYGQLVEDHIFQYRPGHRMEDSVVLGPREICDKWGVESPLQVIDMLAICGDTADNVPGVRGVGPVGAAKLIKRYGSLDGIYEHLDELSPKQKQMFEEARSHIGLSRTLVTIKTDIRLDVSASQMALDASLTPEVSAIFDFYEMPSLKRLLSLSAPAAQAPSPAKDQSGAVGIPDVITVAVRGRTVYVDDGKTVRRDTMLRMRRILEDPSVPKAGHNIKGIIRELDAAGVALNGKLYDVELMHYLLKPEAPHSLESLASSLLGIQLEAGDGEQISLFDSLPEDDDAMTQARLAAVRSLLPILLQKMSAEAGLAKVYDYIEEPLIRVLARMECNGVRVDMSSLREFSRFLATSLSAREAEVRELAGVPSLNILSPKQIGEVIFEKLKLDPLAKKPKKGNWPTDEATLQELSDRSPIINAILDFRGLHKLLNTYIAPFPSYVSERDGRVHTTFNQALTSTGRLSSSNPNLQNIPIRTELGREIRKAFVPGSADGVIMSADYSQIELRIMAHLSGDENLRAAFRDGIDVHCATAAKIYRLPVGEVSAEQRRAAKTANFGIMYGISAFGLSQRLGCSRSEAKQLIDDYFASFPSIRDFIESTLSLARDRGYVETAFGRRHYVPDIDNPNRNLRAFAERNAVNAPIQGTAADIIKMAMVAVDRRIAESALESKMVLQIHDELLLEVPSAEIDAARDILVREMEGVVNLSVPLTVECNYGKTWLEAH